MEEVLFEDAFNLKQGNHLAINDLHTDGFDVFGANGIVGKFDKYMYEEPTVLVTCRGATCGSINMTTPKSWVTGNAIALVPKIKVDSKYIYYQLKGTGFKDVISGSAQPQIIVSTLSRKKFKLLPFEEQQKIASILEQADAARQKRKQANQLTEQFLQSAFLEMFGDPVRNEKAWEKCKVIDVCDCIVPGRDKPKSFSGNIPWITTDDLDDGAKTFFSKKNLGLTTDEIKEVRARIIPKESVLITCVGDLGVVSIAGKEMVINQQLHSFQCSEKISNIFLMHCLKFQSGYMYKMASSTTVPYMNKTICNSIPIILPSRPLQQKFATLVEQVEQLRVKQRESEKELNNLFNSLMQRYFG